MQFELKHGANASRANASRQAYWRCLTLWFQQVQVSSQRKDGVLSGILLRV